MYQVALLLLSFATSQAMPQAPYESLVSQVRDESFASDQLAVLRLSATANTFTPDQVAQLLSEFSFGSDQMDALAVLAPCLEPGDTSVILQRFSFSTDRDRAARLIADLRPEPIEAAPASGVVQNKAGGSGPGTVADCPVNAASPPLTVNWSSTWGDDDFRTLLTGLEAQPFSGPRLEQLREAVASRPEGLSGPQVVQILGAFDFSSSSLERVLTVLDTHLLGMTVDEVRTIIDAYSFSEGKLAALDVLSDTITDVEHKHRLLDAFTFSSDKARAEQILATVTPRSFLFGTVYTQRVVFVVDVSGSMAATFRNSQGRSLSRLDFVRCELDSVLANQLAPTSNFSIVTFSDRASAWKQQLVSADASRIADARTYVANVPTAGATNVDAALTTALLMNPDVVYILTDGAPTAGRLRSVAELTEVARTSGKTIHAVAFLTGSHSGDNKPMSRELMRSLAAATGGVYRAVE